MALEGEFEDVDGAYHDLQPSIQDALESLLASNRDEFVVVR